MGVHLVRSVYASRFWRDVSGPTCSGLPERADGGCIPGRASVCRALDRETCSVSRAKF